MSDQLYDELLASIRTRLRPVCANMPGPAFDRMTSRIADIEWKYVQVSPLLAGEQK